jgi:hypothetical protein
VKDWPRKSTSCEIIALKSRRFSKREASSPQCPPGVRVVKWNLKEPPIAIEYHAVVTDPAKFARATLGELRERLTNPKRKYGWSVEQLIDRLSQVGVAVALESAERRGEAQQ